MANILLLGAGTQGLAIAKALYSLNHQIFLLCGERGNYADKSRYVKHVILAPESILKDEYLDFFLSVVYKHKIDVVIPMGDTDAIFISENLPSFKDSVKVKLPTYLNFLRGYDKNNLMSLCASNGYSHPKTIDLSVVSQYDKSLASFRFPAMLKPNLTTGGRGMVKVVSYEDFISKYERLHKEYGDYHIQEFIPAGGRQFKVQMYIDENKKLIQSTAMQKNRWYPIQAGSNCCATMCDNPDLINMCYHILVDIDWLGFADFDIIEDPRDGRLLVMEINPRVPACIELPIASGINWAEIILNGYLDLPQKNYSLKPDLILRHLGLDFLWFVKSKSRWQTKPNWFHFIGPKVHYQDMSDWTDPLPFLCGTWHNIRNLMSPSFRKQKGV